MQISLNTEKTKKMLLYNCLSCEKCFVIKFDEKVKDGFKDTLKFCKSDLNIYIFYPKGVYFFEYRDGWDKFEETFLPKTFENLF